MSIEFKHNPNKQGDHNFEEIMRWWAEVSHPIAEGIEGTDCATYHSAWDCLRVDFLPANGERIRVENGDRFDFVSGRVVLRKVDGNVY